MSQDVSVACSNIEISPKFSSLNLAGNVSRDVTVSHDVTSLPKHSWDVLRYLANNGFHLESTCASKFMGRKTNVMHEWVEPGLPCSWESCCTPGDSRQCTLMHLTCKHAQCQMLWHEASVGIETLRTTTFEDTYLFTQCSRNFVLQGQFANRRSYLAR